MISVLSLALLPAALAAAPPADAPVAGDPGRIAAVTVEGNHRVEAAVVKNAIASKEGTAFDATRVRDDVRALWKLGYFDDVQILADAVLTGVTLVVRLVEKPAVREVRVQGNKELSDEDLKEFVDVKAFSILDRAALRRNARKLQEKYVEKGHFLAEVSHRIEPLPENEVDVVFVVNEHAKVMVKRISFVGNRQVPSSELRASMQTSEGDALSFFTSSGTYRDEVFQRDLHFLQGAYYDRGFVNIRIGRPQVALTPDKRFIFITIPIEEGDRYQVGTIDFVGDILESKEALHARLGVKTGDVFNRTALQRDMLAITDVYHDQGYAYANITPLTAVDADKKTLDLTFDVRKGSKVIIERIEITGNTKTRDRVIRRELRVYEGELYTGTGTRLSRQRVMALGYFESVDVTQKKGSADDRVVLTVDVKEKPTGTFQIGFGFSSQESFIFTAQISQNNLFGWGQTASLGAQFTGVRSLFQLSFIDPYFLDSRWIFSFDAFRIESDFLGFRRRSFGGSIAWGYHLLDDLMLHVGYTAENVATELSGEDLDLANALRNGFTSSLRFTINWDRRDNRLFPTSGTYHSASVEVAPQLLLGSQFVYNRYSAFSRWYFPLFFGIVFKVNASLGYMTGDDIPISELYYLGGINTVRGYTIHSLSPVKKLATRREPDAFLDDRPVGGDKQVLFNIELEFPIFEKVGIRGVVFYDLGNAFAPGENYFYFGQTNPKGLPLGLFHSFGFGFRWFSPIGPLRFEWGIPLQYRPGIDQPPPVFEFTIGNFF